jgi:hypothetical protein
LEPSDLAAVVHSQRQPVHLPKHSLNVH